MAANDNPEKKFAAGMKAMDEGDFKKAYTAFKKLASENPNDPECWYYKAESGNYASGMFGAKITPEEIMEAYNKAIELDGDKVDYYQSYGSFCISVNKYDEAEKAYNEAAQIDESMESSLYSEFAIEYFNNVMASYGEIMEDPKARAPYAKKALEYMLKALDISAEEAKSLL
jgi:tetratricopeptide (TPR) repeat protein